MAVKIGSDTAPEQNGKLDVSSIRATYEDGSQGLLEADADADPLKQFDTWCALASLLRKKKEEKRTSIPCTLRSVC